MAREKSSVRKRGGVVGENRLHGEVFSRLATTLPLYLFLLLRNHSLPARLTQFLPPHDSFVGPKETQDPTQPSPFPFRNRVTQGRHAKR